MLDVREVSKRFGDVVALDGVSLRVGDGSIVGFLGPNGAGKSTTMRAVMGLIAIDSGAITWNGSPITSATRRRFGYMPAERGMYPKMTVRDQLVYFARLAGLTPSDAARAAATWMQRVDIAHRFPGSIPLLSRT
jgi:ABC-2 type transport system ATP-binding protein